MQLLMVPTEFNEVVQCDFTDYETEDGETYHIGCVTEYLSRFNLVSKVVDTETAFDLIDVTEMAVRQIADMGHRFPKRIVIVTDNGPAMKSRRYRNFIEKTDLLVHVRGQKYHPQTIGREERYHGSLKLEWLYRDLPLMITGVSITPSLVSNGSGTDVREGTVHVPPPSIHDKQD